MGIIFGPAELSTCRMCVSPRSLNTYPLRITHVFDFVRAESCYNAEKIFHVVVGAVDFTVGTNQVV